MSLLPLPSHVLPLPSHVHYELLLQVLERQTLPALTPGSSEYMQAQQAIIHLRKAFVHQKQLEDQCCSGERPVDYRWSLNRAPQPEHCQK